MASIDLFQVSRRESCAPKQFVRLVQRRHRRVAYAAKSSIGQIISLVIGANFLIPVFPTTVIGDQSFGWGYFQEPTPILVTTPDSNNPLNLFTSIGGKLTLGVTRFEDTVGTVRIIRAESAISN